MEENKKTVCMTKRGAIWYTIISFLIVTLLIFTAVMITYNMTVEDIGKTFSTEIALQSTGFTKSEVKNLKTEKTFRNEKCVFEVTFTKDGEKHTVVIDCDTAQVINKSSTGGQETPETPESPEEPSVPETPESPEEPSVPETPEQPEEPSIPETPESPEEPSVPETPDLPSEPTIPDEKSLHDKTINERLYR